jgi:hypothetical protein
MRPTIERAYQRGRFRGRRSLHQQGREIATRVTKSGDSVDADRDKAKDREQSGSWERGRQFKSWENSDGFIHDVRTPVGSLRVCSSSDGLGRPGLGSQLRE